MLQKIRDRITGRLAIVVLAILGLPFLFFGVPNDIIGVPAVATVNGEEIPMFDFENAYRQQLANYGSAATQLPAELRALVRENVLNSMIYDMVVDQYLAEENYRIPDEVVMRFIGEVPEFQVDGRFDKDAYYGFLADRGIDPAAFEASQRISLRQSQVQRGIGASAFVTPAEYRRFLNLVREEREVSVATFDVASVAESIEVTDEDVQAYYDARPNAFRADETVDFKYVELRRDELQDEIEITEAEIRQYYEEVGSRFTLEEQRRARHILLPFGDDEAAAEEQARALAERARAGEPFADLAQQYSQDSGTASNGGDLGLLVQTALPGVLGDTIFSMQQGDIAGPVRSDFGFHVIQLDQIQAGGPMPLEQARSELIVELREEKADAVWRERERAISDALFDAEDVDAVAAAVGLEARTVTGFSRQGGEPFGNNQVAIDTVFAPEMLEERMISDLVELDANRSVVIQVTNYQEAERLPIDEVRDTIVAAIRNERAREIVSEQAEALAAQVEGGADFAAAAEAAGATATTAVIRRDDTTIDGNVRAAAFAANKPAPGAPHVGQVGTTDGAIAVYALTRVEPGRPESIPVAQRDEGKRQLASRYGQADYAAFVFELERNAEISRNVEAFEQQSLLD